MELGALSLRLEETGGAAIVAKLKEVDRSGAAAAASLKQAATAATSLGSASTAAGTSATTAFRGAAAATQTLSAAEKALNKEIADGTRLFTLQGKAVDVTSQIAIQELRESAAAQKEWLRAIGASAEQQARFNLAVQQFEKRVSAATGAQQKSVDLAQRQTAAVKQLGGTYTKADGQLTSFSKGGIRALNGLAFAFSQFANQGEASLRTVASQLTGVLSLMGKGGAWASIVSTISLATFDIVKAGQKRALDKMVLDRQTAIRNTLTLQKAFLDRAEANETFAYAQGVKGLSDFYDARARIIRDRTQAEITAREQQAASLEAEAGARLDLSKAPKALRDLAEDSGISALGGKISKMLKDASDIDIGAFLKAGTLRQVDELLAQAKVQRAEAQALRDQGAAEDVRNTQERMQAEKALAEQVRGFDAARLEAQGKTHQARLGQIEVEAEAYRKSLQQQGTLDASAIDARVKAFTDAMRAQASLQEQQTALSIIQTQLDTQRLMIQQDLAAGRITETEAAQRTADAETSMLPTMRELVQRALQFAAALGDEGALASLRQLKAELEGLGRNTQLDAFIKIGTDPRSGATVRAAIQKIITDAAKDGFVIDGKFLLNAERLVDFARDVDAQFENVLPNIANVLGDTLAAAFSGGMGDAGDVLLRGLGGIMQQMGGALITYGLAMSGLLPALVNPFTSGPAAIAAGVLLTALGGLLGGMATGKGGGRGAARGPQSAPGADTFTIHVAQAGSARRSESAAGLTGMQTAPTANPVTINLGLWNPNDPATERLVGQTMARAQRRGY
jgi:hypothetical protein